MITFFALYFFMAKSGIEWLIHVSDYALVDAEDRGSDASLVILGLAVSPGWRGLSMNREIKIGTRYGIQVRMRPYVSDIGCERKD